MAADTERKLRERVAELEADVEWTHPSYNSLLDELEVERAARVRAEEALGRALERLTDRYGDWEFADELAVAAVPEKDTDDFSDDPQAHLQGRGA